MTGTLLALFLLTARLWRMTTVPAGMMVATGNFVVLIGVAAT